MCALEGKEVQNHLQLKIPELQTDGLGLKFQIHHFSICKMGINLSHCKDCGSIGWMRYVNHENSLAHPKGSTNTGHHYSCFYYLLTMAQADNSTLWILVSTLLTDVKKRAFFPHVMLFSCLRMRSHMSLAMKFLTRLLKVPEFSSSHTTSNLGIKETFWYVPSWKERREERERKKRKKGLIFFSFKSISKRNGRESHAHQLPNCETDQHLKHPCLWHT